jgi:DNA-binding NarL/FixJ family response regulator
MNPKINIIITDDQNFLRDSLASLLKEYNIHAIGLAKNGKELLQLVKTLIPDVILLDIEMPEMDGSTVLDILLKEKPHLKIIMLSQYDENALKENFILRGAKSFMTKSSDIKTIADEIIRIHTSGSGNSYSLNQNFLFTKRELEIIPIICAGKSTKEICSILNLDIKTVEAHRKRIYKKTGAKCIGEFLKIAFQNGLHYLKAVMFFIS